MDANRTTIAQTAAPPPPIRGTEADSRPRGADGDSLRAAQWHPVEDAPDGDGLRVRQHLLAPTRGVAAGGGVEAAPSCLADRVASARPTRSGARRGRQCVAPRAARGKKTG